MVSRERESRPVRPLQPPGHPTPPTPPTSRRKLGFRLVSANEELSFAPTAAAAGARAQPASEPSMTSTPTPMKARQTLTPALPPEAERTPANASAAVKSDAGEPELVTCDEKEAERAAVRTLVSSYDRNFGTLKRKKLASPHRIGIRDMHELSFEESMSNPSTPAAETASAHLARLVALSSSVSSESARELLLLPRLHLQRALLLPLRRV